jgi:predicted component of type VI protein secretion system
VDDKQQLKEDHQRLLYIAGALEAYFQWRERAGADDEKDHGELRQRIQPLVQELRGIRHRAAGLPPSQKHPHGG